ncbi:MAG: acetylornithine/succinylornithine family transaminase [Anaerolineales bacterium]|nr:acetylornithine/succinylornithine family transaminase [Anaerolineales bacterium]MCS7247889.1 acetylornithine/succinylornithine family transaminase [Anaerolineales bacterium]MDW8161699.1 acetylornithine/succinylornithine family transaminase [Anaerolineales bacterium]MDW8446517.1 acetylornithine/succinylornithine family transaminase [Anaerolineales bacterium]
MKTYQELEAKYTSGVYAKRNLTIVAGKGALLYDDQGREYIDCVGGQGVANLGHAHPAIAAAIAAQAQRLTICPEMFYNDQRAKLSERLCTLTGMSRVFLCNSGTEAVEAALKFARATTRRPKIVAAMRAFHGRTMGSLSATFNKKYKEAFEPLVPGFSHVPYNNLEKLSQAVDDQTAAVILEVVQGEGGVYPGSAEFLQGAQDLCRERGALLIIDEVQTGWGRTGKWFAYQHYGLDPDLVCVAKSMAGGLPMGATLIGERVGPLEVGWHGSTFGGNPLACAASLAALEVIEKEDLPGRAARLGEWMQNRLRQISSPRIREVRGLGLIIGIELKQKVAPYIQAMAEQGVLVLNAGMNVIRLLPPLVIEQEHLERVAQALETVLTQELATEEAIPAD